MLDDRYNFGVLLNLMGLRGEAVEVGSHRGEFAHRLLALWQGDKLWCVDPFVGGYDDSDPVSRGNRAEDRAAFDRIMLPYRSRHELILESSPRAAGRFEEESLAFAYVDACHTEAATLEDLEAWWPKVRTGGVLAGHDFLERTIDRGPVQRAVRRFADPKDLVCYLLVETSGAPWSYYFIKGGAGE